MTQASPQRDAPDSQKAAGDQHAMGEQIMARIEALAAISESPHGLTRRYLTPEHRAANDLVARWMQEAGMAVREDAVGNVIGRYEGRTDGAPAVMIGSHLDTVADAGKYDGMLGVLSGIACVDALNTQGRRLDHAVEVIGFADEEGTRFQSTYLGSRAVAGTFDKSVLERRDHDGISMAEAMRDFGLDPARIADAARARSEILAYLELHIEQGPVLESEGLAVGVVTAIAGATRLSVTITGVAGHAGTVPMPLRNDALTAAAVCVLAVEELCKAGESLVGTVGQLEVSPGSTNVIPGLVRFSVDLRAPDNGAREAVVRQVLARIDAIAGQRGVTTTIETVHEAASVGCAPGLMDLLARAIEDEGHQAIRLPSGAGHDAAAMASLADAGMLFVRCRDGISHNPAESITVADADAGARVLLRAITTLRAAETSA